MSYVTDIAAALRGFRKVCNAAIKYQCTEASKQWNNSALKACTVSSNEKLENCISEALKTPSGIQNACETQVSNVILGSQKLVENVVASCANRASPTDNQMPHQDSDIPTSDDDPLLHEHMPVHSMTTEGSKPNHAKISTAPAFGKNTDKLLNRHTTYTDQNKRHLHYDQSEQITLEDLEKLDSKKKQKVVGKSSPGVAAKTAVRKLERPIGHFSQTLSDKAKESKVPGTRFGRLASFGGLAAGLGVGALTEATKRGLGINEAQGKDALISSSPLLSGNNAERIVSTLCRVRGAALKLGQMLSIQDNSLVSPELQQVFERVRNSADFMPSWQMEKVLSQELGSDWQSKLSHFEQRPFAAASIGQVHRAVLHDGREVAIKIQYPGVADSIDSDINNLKSIMSMWSILPEGLYIDSAIKVARKELGWEVDYIREAQCLKKFRELISKEQRGSDGGVDGGMLYVPEVIDDLSTKKVITTELVNGMPLDKMCDEITQEKKNEICRAILNLCLQEVFVYNFMQTDPNWSNFLYDKTTDRVSLLDFGASRGFGRHFTSLYLRAIHAASQRNRDDVLRYSRDMGFLTGYESKVMENAHIDTVMILGEAFTPGEVFDFSTQSTASRVQDLIPVMLRHRLTPPPEESYSLHRKLAGCFLLCTKLTARIDCYSLFDEVYRNYNWDAVDDDVGVSPELS